MFTHKTVLLKEAIQALEIEQDGIYIDATFGRGGHSKLILEKFNEQGRLIALDRDLEAIKTAQKIADPRFSIYHQDFAGIAKLANQLEITNKVSGILFDLGLSSPQIDDAKRGFSFAKDGVLDMRMDNSQGESASDWIAKVDEKELCWILKNYGEERFAKRIANEICKQRKIAPITSTLQLAEIIKQAMPIVTKNKHPATRSFQAIRIHINQELKQIEKALQASLEILKPKGRLAVISFHSLEDRMVKQFIQTHSTVQTKLPLPEAELNKMRKLEKQSKAIKPSNDEIALNPRARSAVLRVASKL